MTPLRSTPGATVASRLAAFLVASSLISHVTVAMGQTPSTPGQHTQRLQASTTRHVDLSYLLFLPSDYAEASRRPWPLMIFLHGAGERGADLQKVAVHGPPKIVKDRPDFPFVVISPQCPEGQVWSPEDLDLLLTQALKTLAVDPARVYLTGLSMGGYGTWAWAGRNPERFAAIAPICGGGDPIGVWLAGGPRREALARLPVWAFHGARDSVVPLAESERMVNAFERIGNKAKLTVYPDADHDSWTATYANQELYDWFLRHRRP